MTCGKSYTVNVMLSSYSKQTTSGPHVAIMVLSEIQINEDEDVTGVTFRVDTCHLVRFEKKI